MTGLRGITSWRVLARAFEQSESALTAHLDTVLWAQLGQRALLDHDDGLADRCRVVLMSPEHTSGRIQITVRLCWSHVGGTQSCWIGIGGQPRNG
jgi:hypothetical protein